MYILFLTFIIIVSPISSHVKWFSNYSFQDQPALFDAIFTYNNLLFAILSILTFVFFFFLDKYVLKQNWYQTLVSYLDQQKSISLNIMRIAFGGILLLSWQADSLLVPKLDIPAYPWVGWWQFFTIFFLLFNKTIWLACFSILSLFTFAIQQFGFFYMLDYLNIIGATYFMFSKITKNKMLQKLGIPTLFITLGFSLYWLGFEKIYYPGWSYRILEDHSILTFGLPIDFFLPAAAFVELALGYILIMGIFERPMSIVITLVFILTSLVFGKVEIIGHTLLHATLIVFLIESKGVILPPLYRIKNKMLQVIFIISSYLIITLLLAYIYSFVAKQVYQQNLL